jgi:hypothetical protein
MKTIPSLITLATLAVGSTACILMHPGAMHASGQTAPNPLVSGQPLEATHKGDVGVVSEPDCSIWPFQDTMTVTATDAQICVTIKRHKDAPSGWTGEPTADRTVGLQVSGDGGAQGGYINAEKTGSSKVGSCLNRGYNARVAIWAFDYKGCTPNGGVLTQASGSLRVGDESWTFPTAKPAPGGGGDATAAK